MTKEEWEAKQNSLKKDIKYVSTGKPGEVKMVESENDTKNKDGYPPIDEKTARSEWNKFASWMDSHKYTGKPDLDKDDYGNKLFRQWQAETKSPLTISDVPKLRQEIVKSIEEQKQRILKSTGNVRVALPGSGEMVWGEKAKPVVDKIGWKMLENEKSKNPDYIGSLFSTWKFPEYDIIEKAKTDPRLSKTITEFNQNKDTTVPTQIIRKN
jgi:hypothetical protein